MTDQNPNPQDSLPPLGSGPASSFQPTPMPPPPPTFPAAEATPAAVVEQDTPEPDGAPSGAAAAHRSRPRTSLLVALIAVLAFAGLVASLVLLMGRDDSSDAVADDSSLDAAEEAPVTAVAAPATTQAPTTTAAPTTTQAPTTTAAPTTTQAPTTTAAPETTVAGPSYPTLPDGSPEPIVAVFDGPVVHLAGWVPSQEKADVLAGLAKANSTDPNATVDAQLQIDPAVPLNIGTRVIELNSPRFNPGSADVTPEHGAQLDRVASVMLALPNVTVTVVGHADQLGDEATNYALSEARAVSVVRYLVGKGVEPARLSARAVGEQDLLADDLSEASLALNRRTEFIFYGLLAD